MATIASDLLQRHIDTLVDDAAQWQTLIADDILWELAYAPPSKTGARSRAIHALYLFTLDKQVWFSRLGWTVLGPCVWQQRLGDIMCKPLQTT
jgi:hypothetical protein